MYMVSKKCPYEGGGGGIKVLPFPYLDFRYEKPLLDTFLSPRLEIVNLSLTNKMSTEYCVACSNNKKIFTGKNNTIGKTNFYHAFCAKSSEILTEKIKIYVFVQPPPPPSTPIPSTI